MRGTEACGGGGRGSRGIPPTQLPLSSTIIEEAEGPCQMTSNWVRRWMQDFCGLPQSLV